MAGNNQLRLEQYETVLYNANMSPLGIPKSVSKAIEEHASSIGRYPSEYYGELKKAISNYAGCAEEHIVLGTGSVDMLKLYMALLAPQKAMIPVPSSTIYESVLTAYGCETDYYELPLNNNYKLDIADFVGHLDSSYDVVIIGNPNNPTSQIIARDDMETLAAACEALEIFLIIDEMYIEFAEKYEELTAIPLVADYENIAVLRSVSKFFAVPGLRLAYSVMNNETNMAIINLTSSSDNISTLTAAACTAMFKDKEFIEQTRSTVFTERNLIYSAMSSNKHLRLFKPYGNFMLVQIMKDGVNASQLAATCNLKGLVIRNCSDFRGLDDSFIRFCFMNPKQNDLLVNTIMESTK